MKLFHVYSDQQELRNKLMAMTKDDVDETGDSVKLLGRGQREKIRKQLSSDDESAEVCIIVHCRFFSFCIRWAMK